MYTKISTVNTQPKRPPPLIRARSNAPIWETCFPRKMLLIDENLKFCQAMRRAAKNHNSLVVYCRSIGELSRLIEIDRFDAVVVNNELNGFMGAKIANFISLFFKDLPVIMLSASRDFWVEDESVLGSNVIGYVRRDYPAPRILVEISGILVRRYRPRTVPLNLLGCSEYTEFCGRVRQPTAAHFVLKRVMAALGKVILANASLVLPTNPS